MGISILAQPQSTASSVASGSAIAIGFDWVFAAHIPAQYASGTWDANKIHENGNMVWDATTGQWIMTYTGESSDGLDHVGALLSADGNTWAPHPDNPISGATNAEDPYIARTVAGEVWRDSDGKALMFCEEKPTATAHRGINLFKSGVNVLTGWTFFGRVLDQGTAGQWDDQDVTSPIVVHDGTQLVMLYEGRDGSLSGEGSSIGLATSADEGETWTRGGTNPILDRLDTAWATSALVCDDVIKVGSTWVLIGHCSDVIPNFFLSGRWSTTDDPGSWDDTSFTEMTGNPFSTVTNSLMFWKNDPRFVVLVDHPQQRLLTAVIN